MIHRFALVFCLLLPAQLVLSQEVETLLDTESIDWPEADLSDRMMDGAHQFVERKIEDAKSNRSRYWQYDYSSAESYAESIADNRRRLGEIIGVVDDRGPARLEEFGDDENPARVAEKDDYVVKQVRWEAVDGLAFEGLLGLPNRNPVGLVVLIPDADQTPELLFGLGGGSSAESQIARRLVEHGFLVIVPSVVSRGKLPTDDERLLRSDQTNREWICRQAFHMGRHVIGYEVQAVLAVVDWCHTRYPGLRIGVAGYGEGGLIAFYSAAIDQRIDVALISGYFDDRQSVWSEPIYRTVWSLLSRFGDAEIASLILPRRLIIEYSPVPSVSGHKGDLQQPDFARVASEFDRIPRDALLPVPAFIHGENAPVGPWSASAVRSFAAGFGIDSELPARAETVQDRRGSFDADSRQKRLVAAQERHVQDLVRESEHVRDEAFLFNLIPQLANLRWSTERRIATYAAEPFVAASKPYRERFHRDFIGQFDEPLLPPKPRTRKVLQTDAWTAWDVVLEVYPELFAYGVLVVPNDLKPGERRPVVVCQHGRNGTPRDTIDGDSTAYNQFAARLAERGFITFAPQNLYRGEDRYRWLDRKAKTVGCTLFSFIIPQHQQILNWLDSLPFVDGDRIGFYGLSFGGESAMQVPTVLEKYCLSICSGYFNDLTRKVAASDQPFSFLRTIEWELPYWNLGNHFGHAEMAYLMVPRPFMVERGHLDLVCRDRWVAHEYARVRYLYAQLGLADQTEIEYFQGGHSINGEGTFDFLHRHLGWHQPND